MLSRIGLKNEIYLAKNIEIPIILKIWAMNWDYIEFTYYFF
jgi:hypothetical protein